MGNQGGPPRAQVMLSGLLIIALPTTVLAANFAAVYARASARPPTPTPRSRGPMRAASRRRLLTFGLRPRAACRGARSVRYQEWDRKRWAKIIKKRQKEKDAADGASKGAGSGAAAPAVDFVW